jgi:hypothetical protein
MSLRQSKGGKHDCVARKKTPGKLRPAGAPRSGYIL